MWGIVLSYILKFLAAVIIYSILPNPSAFASDAANYYYPDTIKLLSGMIPYRDFDTRYSPLFLPLNAAILLVYSSVVSIVLLMIVFELLMIISYIWYYRKIDAPTAYRSAFLFSLSPVSLYWTGVVGYNAIIISTFIMLALIAADRKRDLTAGLFTAASFLFCKLLAFLAWPGVILFRRKGISLRALFPAISIVFTFSLLFFGIDSLLPIKKEFGNYTGGNFWYILTMINPQLINSQIFQILPVICFGTIFLYLFYMYIVKDMGEKESFDRRMIFIGVTFLLFMVFSKKTFNMYHPMMLFFIVHPLVKANFRNLPMLLSITFIGSVSYIEVKLFELTRFSMDFHDYNYILLFIIDILLVSVYVFIIINLIKYNRSLIYRNIKR